MILSKPTLCLLAAALLTLTTAQVCPRADTEYKSKLVTGAKAVLDGNWVPTMNSTLPSPNLYPHQWSWDAAFVAMGYSHYDTGKAIDETNALFRGQWQNGLIPHIVFNPSAVESYFPGPTFWKIETAGDEGPAHAYTSGIIQPPVHALASVSIFDNAPAGSEDLALEHLNDIYPKLVAWHEYLYRERDPLNRGLVFIRHMWESGMDNSPAWDPVLSSMKLKEGDVPEYHRVDKGKVGDHKERPDSFFYDRAVHLIKIFYDNSYNEKEIFNKSPFVIEDVLFNSIFARAGDALARIATILNRPEEARHHRDRAAWTASAITNHLYNEEDGFFYNYDMVAKRQIRTRISGGLAGVFGARIEQHHLNAMVSHLYSDGFLGKDLSSWTMPSVARDDPGYTNTTYWKGPAWINMNYLVRDGLIRNAAGNRDALRIAEFLKERSLELMDMSGFYEYFNPISGSPHGGHEFSWSAALAIDWVCSGNEILKTDIEETALSGGNRSFGYALAVLALIVAVMVIVSSLGEKKAPVVSDEEDDEEDEVMVDAKGNVIETMRPRTGLRMRARTSNMLRPA